MHVLDDTPEPTGKLLFMINLVHLTDFGKKVENKKRMPSLSRKLQIASYTHK